MAHEFGEYIPELLSHCLARIDLEFQPFSAVPQPTSKYLSIVAFPNFFLKIVGHGHLSKSAVFDRFSHIWRALGLQVLYIFQSARGLGGPFPLS